MPQLNYSAIRQIIIDKCKAAGACEGEFKKLKGSTTEEGFWEVIVRNAAWCSETKVITSELLEQYDSKILFANGIYITGKHEVTAALAYALGNSQVTAWENSQVTARENSQVTAWENSQVTAWENSQVTARENSQVTARGNSQVRINNEYFKGKTENIKLEDSAILNNVSEKKIYVKKSTYQIVEI